MAALDVVSVVLAAPVVAMTGYLALLTARSSRLPSSGSYTDVRFDVLIPAHNEASGIAATIASLRALEYPTSNYRVLVVADNCTDTTAALARAAGATVLERVHETEKGKGYALAHGYAVSQQDRFADAVVVVDADTSVSTNLLQAFASRIAAGEVALQAEYGVRNALASWRTRLMVIALTLFHTVRSRAREHMHLSCGLRGNGMAFTSEVLRRVPPRAFSIVEDVEYGIALGKAGVRVAYVHDAHVHGDMPASAAASRSQRERWESGRVEMIRRHVPALLKTGGRVANDLAADLLVPPLTTIGACVLAGSLVFSVLAGLQLIGWSALLPWLVSVVFLLSYVVRGAMLSGAGPRAILDLLWAPVFALWKVTLLLKPTRRTGDWVRTTRPDEI
jgi:1,2-diacylglycerol 3-beta-glucosyltransferase